MVRDLQSGTSFSTMHSSFDLHFKCSHGLLHSQSSQLFKLLTRPYLHFSLQLSNEGHL